MPHAVPVSLLEAADRVDPGGPTLKTAAVQLILGRRVRTAAAWNSGVRARAVG